jgi:hypothetical protein
VPGFCLGPADARALISLLPGSPELPANTEQDKLLLNFIEIFVKNSETKGLNNVSY